MAQVTAQDPGSARRRRVDARSGVRPVVAVTATVIGAAAFVAALGAGADQPRWVQLPLAAVIGGLLVCAVAVDLEQHRIPNRATGPAAVALVVLLIAAAAAGAQWSRLGVAVLTVAAVAAAGIAGAVLAGLGMGDVKLLAVLALPIGWLSPHAVLALVVVSILAQGIAAVLLLVTRRSQPTDHLPMAASIGLGAAVALALI